MKFNELIEEYRIVTDKDKVRHNSADDFGLGPKFVYLGGDWVGEPPVRTSVYGKLREGQDAVIRHDLGAYGSVSFIRWLQDEQVHAIVKRRDQIGQRVLGIVTDIPPDVEDLIVE